MEKKLIVIGLDGASWLVLNRMIKRGITPNLGKLKEKGCWGTLKSTIPPVTPTAWASIQTGVNPGKHGVFTFQVPDRKDKGLSVVNGDSIQTETLFEFLDEEGLGTVLVNMPLSQPPRTDDPNIGGMMARRKVYPSRLKEKYDFSDYQMSFYEDRDATDKVSNLKAIYSNLKNNFPIVKELFKEEEWDLFFYLFSHTDWAQHEGGEFFFHDKNGRKADLVKKIFSLVDEKIGWFLKQVDEDTNLILLSDHGFKYYDRRKNLTSRLKEKGLIELERQPVKWEKENSLRENIASNLVRTARRSKLLSTILEKRHPWFCSREEYELNEKESLVVWKDPKFSSLYINDERLFNKVKKRDKVLQKLEKIIRPYEDKINVFKKEDIYWGKEVKNAPEIVLMPEKYLPSMFKIYSEEVSGEFQHSIDGIFLGYGQDFTEKKLDMRTVYDITPTILHYFDVPLSKRFDGEVIKPLFEEDTELDRGIKYRENDEKSAIKDSIKSLDI